MGMMMKPINVLAGSNGNGKISIEKKTFNEESGSFVIPKYNKELIYLVEVFMGTTTFVLPDNTDYKGKITIKRIDDSYSGILRVLTHNPIIVKIETGMEYSGEINVEPKESVTLVTDGLNWYRI